MEIYRSICKYMAECKQSLQYNRGHQQGKNKALWRAEERQTGGLGWEGFCRGLWGTQEREEMAKEGGEDRRNDTPHHTHTDRERVLWCDSPLLMEDIVFYFAKLKTTWCFHLSYFIRNAEQSSVFSNPYWTTNFTEETEWDRVVAQPGGEHMLSCTRTLGSSSRSHQWGWGGAFLEWWSCAIALSPFHLHFSLFYLHSCLHFFRSF